MIQAKVIQMNRNQNGVTDAMLMASQLPEVRARANASARLEERVRIAEEKASKLRERLRLKQEREQRKADRAANRVAHGMGAVWPRVNNLEMRLSAIERELGIVRESPNGG